MDFSSEGFYVQIKLGSWLLVREKSKKKVHLFSASVTPRAYDKNVIFTNKEKKIGDQIR